MERVFSVQNWMTGGVDGEVRQALVADVAQAASGNTWCTDRPVSALLEQVFHTSTAKSSSRRTCDMGLPVTVVRPGPFMELMTDKAFYPALAVWGAMPKVVGWELPVPWVAVGHRRSDRQHLRAPGRDRAHHQLLWRRPEPGRLPQRLCPGHGQKPQHPAPLALFQKMAGPEGADVALDGGLSGNGGPRN